MNIPNHIKPKTLFVSIVLATGPVHLCFEATRKVSEILDHVTTMDEKECNKKNQMYISDNGCENPYIRYVPLLKGDVIENKNNIIQI